VTIDRKLWQEPVTRFRLPRWQCPRCGAGHFVLVQDSIHWRPRASGYAYLDEYPEGRGDDIELRFSALAECDNQACRETACLSGTGIETRAPEGGGLYHEFVPTHFSPSPDLFRIPNRTPEYLRRDIRIAFEQSWGDVAASLNRSRSC